jgi:multiple sugar transport system permease protein
MTVTLTTADPTPVAVPSLAADRRARADRRRRILKIIENAVLAAVALLILFPIVWMVLTAFKSPVYVYSYTIWFPPTLDNFREVFSERWQITNKIINSTVIAVSTVLIAIPIATCAAYAFSRLQFPLKRAMFQWILLTQFIPAVTIVLPFYVMFRQLDLLDTYAALIIVDLAIVLPYAVWTIKGFIDAIPMETEEAAIVDGASRARVIWDIVVPMARPGILTAAIFCFIITWNEFLFGYLLSRQRVVPLSVGIVGFVLERGPVWELIAATGIIITIPMFFFALIIQRHFTKGMNLGAVR